MRLIALLFALLLGTAHAEGWPTRTVTFVLPYAPGGGHDAMARIVAEKLTARLGQPVIVENKAGASGMLGTELVVRAPADGYTFLFSSPAEIVIAPSVYKSVRYDWRKDLAPITQVGSTPLVIVANPNAGVKTLPELIALAKRKPISFGTPGTGSSQHLAGAWLNKLAGIDMQHIPYKGAGPATNDVLGGQIPIAIVGMAPVLGHIKSGRLIPLAVTTPTRVEWAKDVPAADETPGLEGFQANHWMGLFAPAGTPNEIIQRMQSEVAAVLKEPDVREKLRSLGIDPVGSSTADFRKFLDEEAQRFATMFKATGLQPE